MNNYKEVYAEFVDKVRGKISSDIIDAVVDMATKMYLCGKQDACDEIKRMLNTDKGGAV